MASWRRLGRAYSSFLLVPHSIAAAKRSTVADLASANQPMTYYSQWREFRLLLWSRSCREMMATRSPWMSHLRTRMSSSSLWVKAGIGIIMERAKRNYLASSCFWQSSTRMMKRAWSWRSLRWKLKESKSPISFLKMRCNQQIQPIRFNWTSAIDLMIMHKMLPFKVRMKTSRQTMTLIRRSCLKVNSSKSGT